MFFGVNSTIYRFFLAVNFLTPVTLFIIRIKGSKDEKLPAVLILSTRRRFAAQKPIELQIFSTRGKLLSSLHRSKRLKARQPHACCWKSPRAMSKIPSPDAAISQLDTGVGSEVQFPPTACAATYKVFYPTALPQTTWPKYFLLHVKYRNLILSVIFVETTWSAIRCCQSNKLSERSFVLRQTLDWTMKWHIWKTSPVQRTVDYSSEVSNLVKFNTSCCPATNAVSERSASSLRRFNTRIFEQLCRINDWITAWFSTIIRKWLTNYTWRTLEINIKSAGKISMENSTSIKTFSNHVLKGS